MKKARKKSTAKRAKKSSAKRGKKSAAKKTATSSRRHSATTRAKERKYRTSATAKTNPVKKRVVRHEEVSASVSPEVIYHDLEKFINTERDWDKQDQQREEWHEPREHGERTGHGRRQSHRMRRRMRELEGRDERRHPRHEPTYQSRRRRRAYLDDESRQYRTRAIDEYHDARNREENPLGESAESAGRLEYFGGHKRHPGLLGNKRRRHSEFSGRNAREREEELIRRRRAIRSKKSKAFGSWDPEEVAAQQELEYADEFDHMYEDEDYQHGGNTEGFGRREGRQKHHRWTDIDLYHEGHARLKSGFNKDGTR